MARIAFCQDVVVEYMGFMCMAAVLKRAGHTVEVFIDQRGDGRRLLPELRAFRPDVVGFSLLTPSVPWALRVARKVKATIGAVTVVGNVHVMICPDLVTEDGIDIACLGEGEDAMLELCAALDAGRDHSRIHGFWVKTPDGIVRNPMREELVDLDEQPYVDRAMYDRYFFFRHSPYLRVMLGRGCPFRCTFCTNPALIDHFGGMKRYVRKRSPASAIAEVEHLIARHPRRVKHVFVIDEVLWVKNDWLREFLALWKERIGLPFSANFRFGGITEDDIRLLAEAGAGPVGIATETGDEEQRKTLLGKPVSDEQILQVTRWLHRYGIEFGSSAFFGLAGDTVADHVRRLPFFRTVNPTYLWTTFFQPYPGLALTRHEDVQRHMPESAAFESTVHHDMYLDLPDRSRLVNLKKVYYLMMKYPRSERPLLWLTKFRIPFLFDLLFLSHFMFFVFWAERISFLQWLHHLKVFALNPLLRKKQPLASTGRPFVPPSRKGATARAAAA
jgi:radical SAM superfamily enzyme YgiQ (UPF0313 family)